jgi:ribonuclease T1
VINNPKAARIVAVVVIAMLVVTLAASLFGCAAEKKPDVDPESGLRIVATADLPKEAQDTLKLIDQGGPYPYSRDGVVFGNLEKMLP